MTDKSVRESFGSIVFIVLILAAGRLYFSPSKTINFQPLFDVRIVDGALTARSELLDRWLRPPRTIAEEKASDARPRLETTTDGTHRAFSLVLPRVEPGLKVRTGASIFVEHCGDCHPNGEADLGPKLRGVGHSRAAMIRQIREGSDRMREIGEQELSSSQLDDLLVYLESIAAVRAP